MADAHHDPDDKGIFLMGHDQTLAALTEEGFLEKTKHVVIQPGSDPKETLSFMEEVLRLHKPDSIFFRIPTSPETCHSFAALNERAIAGAINAISAVGGELVLIDFAPDEFSIY